MEPWRRQTWAVANADAAASGRYAGIVEDFAKRLSAASTPVGPAAMEHLLKNIWR